MYTVFLQSATRVVYPKGKYTNRVSNDVLRIIYTEGLKEEVHGDIALGGVDSSSRDYIGNVGIRKYLYWPLHHLSEHVYCVSLISNKSSIS